MGKTRFIDSHCHLYLDAFNVDRADVVAKAIASGVDRMLLPNIDSSSIESMHQLASQFPENCFPMMGLHPTSVKENYKEELQIVAEHLKRQDYIAIGEIGIDLYWDKTFLQEQQEAFKTQLNWAKEMNLPVVIHARDSFNEIFEVMEECATDALRGVFHSFTGSLEQAKKALSYSFFIGINGIVSFKNSGLDKVVQHISPEHLLLETDAPFLAPTPHRGKRNESAYVKLVAEKIAELHGRSVQEIAEMTSKNSLELFGRKIL